VTVHPAPCLYVVQGPGIGGQHFELSARGKGFDGVLSADHRQWAEQAEGVELH
jgi:hypothetical protein